MVPFLSRVMVAKAECCFEMKLSTPSEHVAETQHDSVEGMVLALLVHADAWRREVERDASKPYAEHRYVH